MSRARLEYNGIGPADRFPFEEIFEAESWAARLKMYRLWIIPISALYVLLVFSGRRWMEHRPAYRLKGALILWNILLGGFSLLGVWRGVPVLSKAVASNGLHSTICDNRYYSKDFVGIWGFLFTLSKIPELGDTVFIVLRKQKLMFLHWYHHATVPLFVMAIYTDLGSPGVWFIVMNFFVHGLMYPYYGLRAAGFRLPKAVAMTITTLQIVQMLMGNFFVIYAAVMIYSGVPCQVSQKELAIAIVLYFSYLILFAQFFYLSYFGGKRGVAKPTKADDGVANRSSIDSKGRKVNKEDQEIRQREINGKKDGPAPKNGQM